MKRIRHSPEQIINKLREADAMLASGKTVAQVIQHLAVSEQTYHPLDGAGGTSVSCPLNEHYLPS